jgi:DNA-binding transcriptional LysR family regulator
MTQRDNPLDLNLLAHFEALIEEAHVSRAAQRVNLSQPAMSLALKRLRQMFEDPLLVHTPRGMVPTLRAQELLGPVRKMLSQSRALLPKRPFKPSESADTFVVTATNFVASMFLAELAKRFAREAPRAQLNIITAIPYRARRWFEDGTTDIGISYVVLPPDDLHIRYLARERLVCIARRSHPAVDRKITLDQLCTLRHVKVRPNTPPFSDVLDRSLAPRGRKVTIGLTVADFLLVPEIVATTDLIAVVPESLVKRLARKRELQVLPVPVDVPPLRLSMIWHERTHRDPARQWLRDLIRGACRETSP